jgi:hypothetical protein
MFRSISLDFKPNYYHGSTILDEEKKIYLVDCIKLGRVTEQESVQFRDEHEDLYLLILRNSSLSPLFKFK